MRSQFRVFRKRSIVWAIAGLLILLIPAVASNTAPIDDMELEDDSIMDLSIEELMEIEIQPTATLTKTSKKLTPAAITIITKEEIETSGARSLDELLDIFVPNLQLEVGVWEPRHLGLRGSMSDRDDKYLLLVNGRVMNDRVHFGVLSERDLPMLADINRVEVVRGPGSAMYGPGALFMVINIITDTARNFEGTEIRTTLGAIDEFYSWEFKRGKQFDDGSGVFLYIGAAEQPGTDPSDAPFTYGKPFTYQGVSYTGREATSFSRNTGYNAAWRDRTKLKIHGQYSKDDFDFWVRYTRGGAHYPMYSGGLDDSAKKRSGEGYQQLTFFFGNKLNVSNTINVDYSFSYDMLDFERFHALYVNPSNHRQDEYHAKVILHWQPHENHSIAVGGEYSHEEFGLPSPGWPYGEDPDSDPFTLNDGVEMPRWSSDIYSMLGEYQWKVCDKVTLFAGGRVDWNRFIKKEEMFSPRGAVVYTPTEKDTLKFIAQRAVRQSTAETMKKTMDDFDEKSDSETMDYYEIRWERQHDENFWIAASGYYTKNSAVAWSTDQVAPLGEISIYGGEIEAIYKTEKAKFTISHGYSKLRNMNVPINPATGNPVDNLLTAEPYGYGHDLANWHNHVTKLTGNYELTDKLSLNGSLNVYWGIPGRKDRAQYTGASIAGFDDPYQESVFLNLGLNYSVSKNLNVRATAHNILGWFDKKYNKRNNGFASQDGGFQTEAPSFSFSLKYIF